ncbi:hypothetical protein [Sessilibacter sp. MAH4]
MPIGEIAGDMVVGVFRLIGSFIVDVIFEILVKGLGYLICRPFLKSIDPDGIVVVLVGFVAWIILLFTGYIVYQYVLGQIEIDRCIDAGGRFNDSINKCEL